MTFLDHDHHTLSPNARAARVKLAVFDVDGVMTDGRLYLDEQGRETKTMHVRDGLGLKRLAAAGVEIAVISGRPSRAVAQRMAALGISEVYLDCPDKLTRLRQLQTDRQLDHQQIAVMGDDLPDLEIMRHAGLALSVADGVLEVRQLAHWISSLPGGSGAVREACELIIAAQDSA